MKTRMLVPVIAVMAVAAAWASVDAVKIVFAPKEGSSAKYKISSKGKLDVGGQSGEFSFSAEMTSKVDKLADGKVTIVSDTGAPEISFNGQSMGDGGMPSMKSTTVLDLADGRVLESKTEPSEGESPRLEAMNQLIFPKAEVKEGDTWTHKQEADSKKGLFTVEYSFTYHGKEKIGSRDTFKIGVSAKETDAEKNMTMTGTFWVDEMGLPVKVQQSVKNAVISEMLPPTDMETLVERVD